MSRGVKIDPGSLCLGLFLNRTSSCRAIDYDLKALIKEVIEVGIHYDVTFALFENEIIIFLFCILVLDRDYFGMTACDDVMFHFFPVPAIDSNDGFELPVNLRS